MFVEVSEKVVRVIAGNIAMSSGKTHSFVTATSSFALGGFGLYHYGFESGLALLVGGLLGLILSPDLDVDNGNISYQYVRKIGLGRLFKLIFKPYAISYRHRSNITHAPVVSTILRLLYVYLPVIVVPTQNQHPDQAKHRIKVLFAALIAQALVLPLVWLPTWYFWNFLQIWGDYALLAFLSLTFVDALHWAFDRL